MSEPDAMASQVVVLPVQIDVTNAEIDVTNAEQVAVQLMAAVGAGAVVVVGDLGGTGFCDSAGVHVLVQVSRRAAERGVQLRLAAADPLRRVLDLMGVNRMLRLYPDVATALAGEAVPGG